MIREYYLEHKQLNVVTGFIGSTEQGQTTTRDLAGEAQKNARHRGNLLCKQTFKNDLLTKYVPLGLMS